MTRRVFVTGVTGFVGSHLLDHLVPNDDVEVFGTVREHSSLELIRHHESAVKLVSCDFVDATRVIEVLEDIRPDYIYHLAGQSSVGSSWKNIHSLVNNNVVATLNLLEAVHRTEDLDPWVLLVLCQSSIEG